MTEMKTMDRRRFITDCPMFWEGFGSAQLGIDWSSGVVNIDDEFDKKLWLKGWAEGDFQMGYESYE